MSRLLRINNTDVDIDEKTAIGLDLQSYDVKEPGKTFINVSNTFNIPATSRNLSTFGLANNPQSKSTKVYDIALCDYWIGNEKVIDQAKVRVESIQERINLFIYEKQDFWEDLKKDYWPDFIDGFISWMNTENNLPIESDPDTGNASDFLDSYFTATEGIYLPLYLGNLADYVSVGQFARERQTVAYGFSLTGWTLTTTITSDLVTGSPVVINSNFSGGETQSQITTQVVDDINNNSAVSEYYTAEVENQGTGKFILKGNEAQPDSNLNIAVSGTFITDEATSELISAGINPSTDTLDLIYDPPFAGLIDSQIYLKQKTQDEDVIGGHFSCYAKTLFEYIEYRYDVNLLTSGGVLVGNIWDDPVASDLFIPIRDLDVVLEDGDNYFFRNTTSQFQPLKDIKDKEDKTVYDFVNAFMRHLNIIKDELTNGGEKVIRFARFDDLETLASIEEFSQKISGTPKFIPRIEGYSQNNFIKFKSVFEEGSEFTNSKTITSSNKNIDINADLIEIDAYVPGIVNTSDSKAVSIANESDSFKTFIFYVSTQSTTNPVNVVYADYTASPLRFVAESVTMEIAALYNLDDEYNFLDEIITYPKLYEIEKWLTIEDIRNFEFFKQYYIQELNGSFFINKIKGFNPDASNKPTTLEIIKVSDRTPPANPDLEVWADGVEDVFIDGESDEWF